MPSSTSTSTSQMWVPKPPSAPCGVELHAGADRPAHRRRLFGELGQRQRLELAGIGADRMRRAVFPFHRFGIDLPDLCGALAQGRDDLLGRLRHHDRGGEQHAAAAGEVGEADGRGVADQHRDAAIVDAEQFGADIGDAGARAADIGMARGDDDVAVLGDVDLRAEDSPPALNQKPEATPRPCSLPSGAL